MTIGNLKSLWRGSLLTAAVAALSISGGHVSAQLPAAGQQPAPPPRTPIPNTPLDRGVIAVPPQKPAIDPDASSELADDASNANSIIGKIRMIKDRTMTVEYTAYTAKPSETDTPEIDKAEKNRTFAVPPTTVIQLNGEPAKLSDLQVQDTVRVTMSQDVKATAARIDAARVDPNAKPGPRPPLPPARTPRTDVAIDRQGGLGVVVADSPDVGILIVDVRDQTPAHQAGLETGDYVMKVDAQPILTPEEFLAAIRSHAPRSAVELTVWRERKVRTGRVTLTSAEAANDDIAVDERPELLAATRLDSRRAIATHLGVQLKATTAGPMIVSVEESGIAAQAALQRGDVIVKVNGRPIQTTEEFLDAVRKATPTPELELTILRDDEPRRHILEVKDAAISNVETESATVVEPLDRPLRERTERVTETTERTIVTDDADTESAVRNRQLLEKIRELEREVEILRSQKQD